MSVKEIPGFQGDSRATVEEAEDQSTSNKPVRLSLKQGSTLCILLLILNSVLGTLGSVLWGHFPYWPAFLVFVLTCECFGFWGLIVAVLAPVVSSLLLIGGSTAYLFVPINLLQALLAYSAYLFFRVDRRLARASDILKYVWLVIAIPSFLGGCGAWLMQFVTAPHGHHDPMINYATWWTLENLLPALVPGIWLHRVIGETYKPFSWKKGGKPKSWLVRTFEYASPWMITIILAGSLIVFMVFREVSVGKAAADTWNRVFDIAAGSHLFQGLVLGLNISLLVSLGFVVKYAKQTWALEEAVRRHFSTSEEAERVLNHQTAPTERHLVTVISTDIRKFTETSTTFRPDDLVWWLNAYLDTMCASCLRHGGNIDRFVGDGILMVFGLRGGNTHAIQALQCSLDMIDQLALLNSQLRDKHFPEINIGIGIHTGSVIAGEIGSRDRRQYTVIGESVNAASRIEEATKKLSNDLLPILISYETVKEAGLLFNSRFTNGFNEVQENLRDVKHLSLLYSVNDQTAVTGMLNWAVERMGGAPESSEIKVVR